MTFGTFDFKCALITGGAGGIGRALATYLLSQNKKVILAGRTESKLQTTASELGTNIPYYVLDTGDVSSFPTFIARITKEHPELDCLINNAGVQWPLDFVNDDAAELLKRADDEVDINIRGPIHLTTGLLPHFKAQEKGAVIVNISSGLSLVPAIPGIPVYSATKSFIRFWTMNLRTQLQKAGTNVRVVDIAPPLVESDLHRKHDDPDDNKKGNNSMALSMEEFMKEVTREWEEGREEIGAGMSRKSLDRWNNEFGGDYRNAVAHQ